jgi:predicted transcriptional regulator
MKFSDTELQILRELALGKKDISELAKTLEKSEDQIYRSINNLIDKRFVSRSNRLLEPMKTIHTNLLLQLLSDYPNIITPLSNSGIKIYTALLGPKSVHELVEETGYNRAMIFRKLNLAINISMINKKNNKYALNKNLWSKLIEFLEALKKYEEMTDKRVPSNSIIYYKDNKEIIFSIKEEFDATPTGFSEYGKYSIKILLLTNYYYLPKKQLTKKQIFEHSLKITEKDRSIRNLIFIALFYLKYKNELSIIKHEIIESINLISEGNVIPGYPTLEEIKQRAEIYDIRL